MSLLTIFLIFLAIVVIIILISAAYNKKKQGFAIYSTEHLNDFIKKYKYIQTKEFQKIRIKIKESNKTNSYLANICINTFGIYIEPAKFNTKAVSILIFFKNSDIDKLNPPSYGIYKSFSLINKSLNISGKYRENVKSSAFDLIISDADTNLLKSIAKSIEMSIHYD